MEDLKIEKNLNRQQMLAIVFFITIVLPSVLCTRGIISTNTSISPDNKPVALTTIPEIYFILEQ